MEANADRIVQMLSDGDYNVREAAVGALINAPAVVERHIEPISALLNHGSWGARESALKVLASS